MLSVAIVDKNVGLLFSAEFRASTSLPGRSCCVLAQCWWWCIRFGFQPFVAEGTLVVDGPCADASTALTRQCPVQSTETMTGVFGKLKRYNCASDEKFTP